MHDLKGGIQLQRLRWVPEAQVETTTKFLAKFRKLFDFENGALDPWVTDGEAFQSQPTYTDSGVVRRQQVQPQGKWYVGTYENRPGPQAPANRHQGDGPTGSMRSPSFPLPDGRVTFLVGGGKDIEKLFVSLHLAETGREVFRATGRGSNLLRRVVWDVSEHAGAQAYLKIVDQSSASWGHVNFDDFRIEK